MGWVVFLALAVVVMAPLIAEARREPMDRNAQKRAPGRFADLADGRTHYQWFGPAKGQVAVCIHGLTTPSYVFAGVVQILTAMGFRVLTYDLYGRGYSDRPAGVQTPAFFLRQLRGLLADQGVEGDLLMVGYSMGGSIATAFAAREKDRVDRLVLIAPAGLVAMPQDIWSTLGQAPLIGDWIARVFGGWLLRRALDDERDRASVVPDILDRVAAETRVRGYAAAVLSSQRNTLAELLHDEHRALRDRFTAVLAIWGADDTVIPKAAVGKLAELNREAHQVEIAGAGHGVLHTHPAELARALQDFLREI